MNAAARLVLVAFVGLAYLAVGAFCAIAILARDLSALEKIAVLILGYLAGVLTRTGSEGAKSAVGPVSDSEINVTPKG